jgi:3-oxoacyl-[acyl-carrier protein] reductase
MRLDGQVAVVTGASRGIGRAIAQRLVLEGAEVVATATGETGLASIHEWASASSGKVHALTLDVADLVSITGFIEQVESLGLAPDILVNNAGVTRDGLLMRMRDEDWTQVIETNLSSVFRLTRALVRGMVKRRHGRIINISSVVAQIGNAGQTNYVAAKAGMIGFTMALARELGGRGITVNAVAPGFIATDMTHALPEAQREALLGQIPLGRLGAAEDIAAAVAFLAGADGAYITGHTLSVNGGMAMG